MSSNQQYIIELCKRIESKNLTPSVALVRSKSARPLSIPEVIQVLKQWKEDKETLIATTGTTEEAPVAQLTLEQRVEQLEQTIALLKQRIEVLEASQPQA